MSFLVFSSVFKIKVLFCAHSGCIGSKIHALDAVCPRALPYLKGSICYKKCAHSGCTDAYICAPGSQNVPQGAPLISNTALEFHLCIIFTTINQHLCTINISSFVLPYIMTKDVIMSYNIHNLLTFYLFNDDL